MDGPQPEPFRWRQSVCAGALFAPFALPKNPLARGVECRALTGQARIGAGLESGFPVRPSFLATLFGGRKECAGRLAGDDGEVLQDYDLRSHVESAEGGDRFVVERLRGL